MRTRCEIAMLVGFLAACSTEVVEVLPQTNDRDGGERDSGAITDAGVPDSGAPVYRCPNRAEILGRIPLDFVLPSAPFNVAVSPHLGVVTYGRFFEAKRAYGITTFNLDGSSTRYGSGSVVGEYQRGPFLGHEQRGMVVTHQVNEDLGGLSLRINTFIPGESLEQHSVRWDSGRTLTDVAFMNGNIIVTSTASDQFTIENFTTRGLSVGFGARQIVGRYDDARVDQSQGAAWVFATTADARSIDVRALEVDGSDRHAFALDVCTTLEAWDVAAAGADSAAVITDCGDRTELFVIGAAEDRILVSPERRRAPSRVDFDGEVFGVAHWARGVDQPSIRFIDGAGATVGGLTVDLTVRVDVPHQLDVSVTPIDTGENRWALAATWDVGNGEGELVLFDGCGYEP